MRILVLGGATEASELVAGLARRPALDVVLSFAGRTAAPRPAPVPTRTGGFGGPVGLADWLRRHGTDLLVDATHPFAATMSANAAAAARETGVALLAVRRPPWAPEPGDRWTEVDGVPAAGTALNALPSRQRVFVTIGRNELAPFLAAAPDRHRYLARAIEPFGDLVPDGREVAAILDRGPFTAEAERSLMEREGIDVLVTKNAGGAATHGKIAAARALGLPAIVVRPPAKPDVAQVADAEAALAWIAAHAPASTKRGV